MISADELRRLYLIELRSPVEIAVMAECTPETVRNRLSSLGIKMRSRSEAMKLSLGRRADSLARNTYLRHADRIKKLWHTDLTNAEIAQSLGIGVTGDTLRKWGKKLGLPRRNRAHVTDQTKPAYETRGAPAFRQRSVITFLPESPRLEMEFRRSVAAARMWRAWS